MSEVVKKPLKITETVLRDAHQSLIATRMTTEQMLPIVDKMDKVGYNAVECWGGATFDACLRRSMGSSQKIKRRLQKYKAPDAFPWTEYLRISSICR